MSKVIGIDLGTTNSCVSVIENGEPVIIPNSIGGRTTPSVVAFSKNGERLIGDAAKRQAVTNSDRTISSVKRHMGTNWSLRIDGTDYKPQTVSALILMQLKKDAENFLGEPVTEAVITVPAYFKEPLMYLSLRLVTVLLKYWQLPVIISLVVMTLIMYLQIIC